MIASKYLTRNLLHSKNWINLVNKKYNNSFYFSNSKPPLPTDIDSGNTFGLLNAN